MIHVLQPFKVTDSDTTSVTQDIRQELDSSSEKNLFSLNSGWSVGSLNNQFTVELVSVVSVD